MDSKCLLPEEMVGVGKKFFEEIFSDKPSREFNKWVEKVVPSESGGGTKGSG